MAKKLEDATSTVEDTPVEGVTEEKKGQWLTKSKLWAEVAPLLEQHGASAELTEAIAGVLKPKERTVGMKKQETLSITERLAAGEITAAEAAELLMKLNQAPKKPKAEPEPAADSVID